MTFVPLTKEEVDFHAEQAWAYEHNSTLQGKVNFAYHDGHLRAYDKTQSSLSGLKQEIIDDGSCLNTDYPMRDEGDATAWRNGLIHALRLIDRWFPAFSQDSHFQPHKTQSDVDERPPDNDTRDSARVERMSDAQHLVRKSVSDSRKDGTSNSDLSPPVEYVLAGGEANIPERAASPLLGEMKARLGEASRHTDPDSREQTDTSCPHNWIRYSPWLLGKMFVPIPKEAEEYKFRICPHCCERQMQKHSAAQWFSLSQPSSKPSGCEEGLQPCGDAGGEDAPRKGKMHPVACCAKDCLNVIWVEAGSQPYWNCQDHFRPVVGANTKDCGCDECRMQQETCCQCHDDYDGDYCNDSPPAECDCKCHGVVGEKK